MTSPARAAKNLEPDSKVHEVAVDLGAWDVWGRLLVKQLDVEPGFLAGCGVIVDSALARMLRLAAA